MAIDTRVRIECQNLLAEYVMAVDERDLDRWVQFFSRDSSYIVCTRESYERGLPVCIIRDDSYDRIRDRVTFVREFWAGHYNENQPRHMLGPVVVHENERQADLLVTANFVVYMTPKIDGVPRLIGTGQYRDIVVQENGSLRFREKRVILDNDVLLDIFVYPL